MKKNIIENHHLKLIAHELRKRIIEVSYSSGAHHIGSALSCIDILTVLYFHVMNIKIKNPFDKKRDWFLLSKGHAALALYLTLEKYGLLKDMQVEKEFLSDGGILGGHPDRLNQYGIEISSGSLGYGLSIGSGVALSAKKDNRESRAFILLGDGECNEGMIWEAVMFASHHRLDNLVAIVDYNNLQGLGYIKDILNLSPLSNKFSSFDWNVREIDGNNIDELLEVFDDLPFKRNMPSVIIANTVKGKGISSMENKLHSHYEVLNEERYKIIMNELDNIILN